MDIYSKIGKILNQSACRKLYIHLLIIIKTDFDIFSMSMTVIRIN
jgi:hypothetical protein